MDKNNKILVTGGASFIGSHMVDALVARGMDVRVVDDLSTGSIENIQGHIDDSRIECIHADLREPGVAKNAVKGIQVVFHLAADHGGRGYIDLHQAAPATNFFMDGLVFWEAQRAGVEKIIFASSGCVYPNALQADPNETVYLSEGLIKPPYEADNLYGWAKLMAELTLDAYCRELGMKAVSCRYFTAYGPRCLESHAVMAMIGRAFIKQDPFEVWGNGEQIRNWTYIDDIVEGTIRAAETIDDGSAVNIGTMERVRVVDAARLILQYTGCQSEISFLTDMPTGPLNRVADNTMAKRRMNWEPQVNFEDGLRRTIDWYFSNKKSPEVHNALRDKLVSR